MQRTALIRAVTTAIALSLPGCALDSAETDDAVAASPAAITGSSSITGTLFQDLNRNLVQDPGELPMAGLRLYLFDGDGQYLANTLSDTAGRYAFTGIADAAYRVELDRPSWWSVRNDWVPTTTGIFPRQTVDLATAAVADFGFRRIVRSTDLAAPLAVYTGPNGLVVKSYDDVVAPETVYASVMAGTVGPEASSVVVHFDYGSGTSTSTSAASSNGQYTGYRANVYIGYESWLEGGDYPISHEYGHAWSLHYAYMVQQDPTMASYLAARGLTGDTRVDSSYAWNTREMIAEDYRQLLGAPDGRSAAQLNTVIPRASEVPGLHDFLLHTFTQPPPLAPPPPPPPLPALVISGPTVSPSPVGQSGTISFGLSAPARVTLTIRNTGGSVVRTLLASALQQAGATSVVWDRRDGGGHKVKPGTYAARVDALDAANRTATASTAFLVK